MFCPECGKQIEDDSKFCEHCGASIESDTKEETPIDKDEIVSNKETLQQQSALKSVKKRYYWKWFLGIIAVCIVLLILFYAYKSGHYASGSSTTLPSFSKYGTDMISIQKYASDLDNSSIDLCRSLRELRDADAIYCLTRREANENRRIDLLREASNLGHPLAQNDLAMILDAKKPQGDSVEIARLIRESANRGIPYAQVTVGWWHMTGEHGFSIDYSEAMRWNLLAYKQGHSEGANNIGELYEKGLGVQQDLEQAKSWYEKASQLGNTQATERLKNWQPATNQFDLLNSTLPISDDIRQTWSDRYSLPTFTLKNGSFETGEKNSPEGVIYEIDQNSIHYVDLDSDGTKEVIFQGHYQWKGANGDPSEVVIIKINGSKLNIIGRITGNILDKDYSKYYPNSSLWERISFKLINKRIIFFAEADGFHAQGEYLVEMPYILGKNGLELNGNPKRKKY